MVENIANQIQQIIKLAYLERRMEPKFRFGLLDLNNEITNRSFANLITITDGIFRL